MIQHYHDAYGLTRVVRNAVDKSTVNAVLEIIHPGNLGALPPSVESIIAKGKSTGIVSGGDIHRVTVWSRHWDEATDTDTNNKNTRNYYFLRECY